LQSTRPWKRHAELVKHVFDHAGWPADEFILYACLVEWPLWRCGYHMLFDSPPTPARSKSIRREC